VKGMPFRSLQGVPVTRYTRVVAAWAEALARHHRET